MDLGAAELDGADRIESEGHDPGLSYLLAQKRLVLNSQVLLKIEELVKLCAFITKVLAISISEFQNFHFPTYFDFNIWYLNSYILLQILRPIKL
ncbi:hypothetical protein OXYTRIMIC_179 [Oxytricha trifallax]|uniref:Uncharacterized protein n=1 Tax=Oxytricha trifallax TaxID=1172189 RepID=A0A073IBM3_9SPIT|nr:hypothetical protein OXYTRIMIC_179 [Oxytricha trifallax]